MRSINITIIGAGNMGTALLQGLIAKKYSPQNICLTDPSLEKLVRLQAKFYVQVKTNNLTALQVFPTDVVIFAVKPSMLASVARELAASIQRQKASVISIAAGVTVERIQEWLGEKTPIVRAMPNMPALIGCGVSALFANAYVSASQRKKINAILSAVGTTVWLQDEKLMDAVTAVSGSGPAYFFLMMEALQQAAEKVGLPSDIANTLILQTAYGAARMALEKQKENITLMQLRKTVTSPAGTTEKAVQALEIGHFADTLYRAVVVAKERAEELGQIIE